MFVMNTEESCFEAELQTKLGFRRFKHTKPGTVPTTFNIDPTQSHVQHMRKEKGPEVLKKGGNICYIKLLEDNFSLKGTIKWLRKGERDKNTLNICYGCLLLPNPLIC